MGITIPSARLELVLERAVALAESDADVPTVWVERVRRIERCPSKTYVAALGTALLARAADDRIDALTIKHKAGPSAYSMRGVVKTLAERAPHYGYHLGRTGPEPLNNQPWFSGVRVDRLANVHARDQPYHRDLVRYLRDLNTMSADEAFLALGAFLRLRIAHFRSERDRSSVTISTDATLEDVIEIAEIFVRADAEGGRRGQALVAAVLDLLHEDVRLYPINDPGGFDVAVRIRSKPVLGVEVKQKAVAEATAQHLAEEASQRRADKALVVALAPDQRRLDRESIRRAAFDEHGVLAVVYEGVGELVTQVALHSPLTARAFARHLAAAYARRLREHGVSEAGQDYWADLVAGLAGPTT